MENELFEVFFRLLIFIKMQIRGRRNPSPSLSGETHAMKTYICTTQPRFHYYLNALLTMGIILKWLNLQDALDVAIMALYIYVPLIGLGRLVERIPFRFKRSIHRYNLMLAGILGGICVALSIFPFLLPWTILLSMANLVVISLTPSMTVRIQWMWQPMIPTRKGSKLYWLLQLLQGGLALAVYTSWLSQDFDALACASDAELFNIIFLAVGVVVAYLALTYLEAWLFGPDGQEEAEE